MLSVILDIISTSGFDEDRQFVQPILFIKNGGFGRLEVEGVWENIEVSKGLMVNYNIWVLKVKIMNLWY